MRRAAISSILYYDCGSKIMKPQKLSHFVHSLEKKMTKLDAPTVVLWPYVAMGLDMSRPMDLGNPT